MEQKSLKIHTVVLWLGAYLGIMLLYTSLDIVVWRTIVPTYSEWVNLIVIMICVSGFISQLKKRYSVQIVKNITPIGIFLAITCSILFFLLLDLCIDPILEQAFPQSEQDYQETLGSLLKSPVTSMLQVCVLAPVIEEILMRGFVLGELRKSYGVFVALFISSLLFALLHFNMVQTFSAFVCGVVLGLLFLKTDSILCCILAHCGYNLLSFLVMVGFIG